MSNKERLEAVMEILNEFDVTESQHESFIVIGRTAMPMEGVEATVYGTMIGEGGNIEDRALTLHDWIQSNMNEHLGIIKGALWKIATEKNFSRHDMKTLSELFSILSNPTFKKPSSLILPPGLA